MGNNGFISIECENDFNSKDVILYNRDCLDVMPFIKDKSIDLIFCDLPYGTTACKWDAIIPFEPLWKEYKRIIKDTGIIVLTASQPFTSLLIASNIDMFRCEWIWEKSQGTNPLNAKYIPLKKHENILVFYKERGTYNPIMTEGTPYKGFKSNISNIGEVYGNVSSVHNENNGIRYPTTIQHFKHDKGKLHPTQKPVKLVEYFLLTYSNEGSIVLDNCMGSGTTGVSCRNTNRKFIGIEKDEKYFNVAKERIMDYTQKVTFGNELY